MTKLVLHSGVLLVGSTKAGVCIVVPSLLNEQYSFTSPVKIKWYVALNDNYGLRILTGNDRNIIQQDLLEATSEGE